MAKLKLIVAILLMAGLAILWVSGRQSEATLRAALQQQIDRTAGLKAEQDRLSNLLAQAADPTAGKQLAELSKLREAAGRLRQQSGELQQLQAQNSQLRSALQAGRAQSAATPAKPSDKPALAVYPRANWSFAGFATPEAALQSFLWANANGDVDTLMAGVTPEAQKQFAKAVGDKSATETADMMKNKMNEYNEFRVLLKNEISDTEVELEVWGDKENDKADKMYFQKIDGQWKFSPETRARPAPPQP